MNERQLQFRVGLLSIIAMVIVAVLVFQFGEMKKLLEDRYALAIHFESAPGVYPSSPARMNGLTIGGVREVVLDDKNGGVLVIVDIRRKYKLRKDSVPRLVRSLLGDTSIEFSSGQGKEYLKPGAKLRGETATDPMEVVNRLEQRMVSTVDSFRATSEEWQQVARNLNSVVDTNEGNIQLVIERAAKALDKFTTTLELANNTFSHANAVLGDPETQQNMRDALAALPRLTEDTQKTIVGIQRAVEQAEGSLRNLNELTGPLAKRGESIAVSLDRTLSNVESLSTELNDFVQLISKGDGSIGKLATDPELYQNLNRSATSLAVLLKNLEPISRDLAIFSDKVARHPELLGVGGALRGSSGLKEPPPAQAAETKNSRLRPGARR